MGRESSWDPKILYNSSSYWSVSTVASGLLYVLTPMGLVVVCYYYAAKAMVAYCWLRRRSSRISTTSDGALEMGSSALPMSRMQAELLDSLPTTLYRSNKTHKKKKKKKDKDKNKNKKKRKEEQKKEEEEEEKNKTLKNTLTSTKEEEDAEMGACSYDISSYDDRVDDDNDDNDDDEGDGDDDDNGDNIVNDDNDDQCPICLGVFVQGERVTCLPPCGHGFHVHCIHKWLSSHSSCPTCRHTIRTKKATSSPSSSSSSSSPPPSSSIILHPSVIHPSPRTMTTANSWTRFLRIAPICAFLT